jgi:hypothetical protein
VAGKEKKRSLHVPELPKDTSARVQGKKFFRRGCTRAEKKICSGRAHQVPEEKRAYNISTIFSCARPGSELRQIKKNLRAPDTRVGQKKRACNIKTFCDQAPGRSSRKKNLPGAQGPRSQIKKIYPSARAARANKKKILPYKDFLHQGRAHSSRIKKILPGADARRPDPIEKKFTLARTGSGK